MRKLSLSQAAEKAGVSTRTIREWLRRGIIPTRRLPGTRKHIIYATDLERNPSQIAA